jgi:hypothetical protein
MLGHTGSSFDLLKPEVNIRYGVRYLAQAWRLANGDLCRTLMKYRSGHGEERMSALSVQYCARARGHLAKVGSSYANAPVPTAVASLPLRRATVDERRSGILAPYARPGTSKRPRTANDSRRFWAAHEARIRTISAKLAFQAR